MTQFVATTATTLSSMMKARDWFGDGRVYVYDLPLACCALESQAAIQHHEVTEIPRDATAVLTLSGTITHAVAPAIREIIGSFESPPVVVAFGACACIGGPYWDSYSVVKGAEEMGIEVDHFIAGCPPPPDALTTILEQVSRA